MQSGKDSVLYSYNVYPTVRVRDGSPRRDNITGADEEDKIPLKEAEEITKLSTPTNKASGKDGLLTVNQSGSVQRLSPRHSRSPARNPRSSPRYPQNPARSPRSSRYLRSPTRSPRSSPRYPQSPARSRRSSRYPRSPTRSPRSSPRYPQSPARSPPRSPTFPQNPARSPHSSPRFPQSPAKSPPRSPRFPQSPARSPPRSPTFPQNPARSPPRSPRFLQSPARIPPRSPRRPRSPPQNIAFPVTELPPSNSQTIVQDDAVGLQHRRVPFQPNASLYNRLYWSTQWREQACKQDKYSFLKWFLCRDHHRS